MWQTLSRNHSGNDFHKKKHTCWPAICHMNDCVTSLSHVASPCLDWLFSCDIARQPVFISGNHFPKEFLIIHFLKIMWYICHANLLSMVLVHAGFCNMLLEARRSSRKVRVILIGEINGEGKNLGPLSASLVSSIWKEKRELVVSEIVIPQCPRTISITSLVRLIREWSSFSVSSEYLGIDGGSHETELSFMSEFSIITYTRK